MGWREPEQQLLKQMLERIHTVVAAADGMVRPIEELLHLPLVEPWVRTSARVPAARATRLLHP